MKKNLLLVLLVSFLSVAIDAQTIQPSLLTGLKYRMIGPHRGGRTVGMCGVPSQPNVFYMGVNNGGVWKTNDFGHTWKPIFDSENTGSVGDVVVASAYLQHDMDASPLFPRHEVPLYGRSRFDTDPALSHALAAAAARCCPRNGHRPRSTQTAPGNNQTRLW